MPERDIDELSRAVRALSDDSHKRLRAELADRLTPQHRIGGGIPQDPVAGASPFDIATLIVDHAVDWNTLASSLFGVPEPSTHANPTQGTAHKIPVLDHDHGLVKGPPLEGLAIGYLAPGQPSSVVRTDTPGGVVSSSAISYSGAQVASVVTTRSGYTITVVPTYTGADITSVARTVA